MRMLTINQVHGKAVWLFELALYVDFDGNTPQNRPSLHFHIRCMQKHRNKQPTRLRIVVVGIIAFVLVGLQFAKPFELFYTYNARIIASDNRLKNLQHNALHKQSDVLVKLHILENGGMMVERPLAGRPAATIPNLGVRNVTLTSRAPLTSNELTERLKKLSVPSITSVATTISCDQSVNRWHIFVLQHQLQSYDWSADSAYDFPNDPKSNVRLVSTQTPLQASNRRSELQAELSARIAEEQRVAQDQMQQLAASDGVVTLSTPWSMEVNYYHVDRLSIIFLFAFALVAVLSATELPRFVVLRQVVADPKLVFERTMRRFGVEILPTVGAVAAASKTAVVPASLLQARFLGMQHVLYRGCEWLIILCCALAIARFVFDDVWRDLCLQSPLAAISMCFSSLSA